MFLSLLLTILPAHALAQSVVGSAQGFATGVTGGGSATPAIPADITELASWLQDDVARVIVIDKTYDFAGSEGSKTATGCRPASNTCGSAGQDALDGPNWCSDSYPAVEVTYDVAATTTIDVGSNKSILGVGSQGVIKGKGLRFVNKASNVIVQNVHFTDLNPQYIWGGDALYLANSDMIWIDHCKFSLVGRQMIVSGFEGPGRVTISNNDFDGNTNWSSSCNGQHYWTLLMTGTEGSITFHDNYLHQVSGRAPKIGGTITFHAANNYFEDSKGHDFSLGEECMVLAEGNSFKDCKTPIDGPDVLEGNFYNVVGSSAASGCADALGRNCVENVLATSGDWPSFTNAAVLSTLKALKNVFEAGAASGVAARVSTNAGVGRLDSSATAAETATSVEEVETVQSSASATPVEEVKAVVSSVAAVPAKETPAAVGGELAEYAQCGGKGSEISASCASGLTCQEWNEWYSQCVSV